MIGRIEWLKKVAILMFLLSLCFANDEIIKIPLNDLQEFSIKASEGGKAYYTATIEEDEKTDLIVQLNSLSLDSDPDLSVFIKLDQKPNSGIKPYCTSDQIGYDVCVIQKEDIDMKKEGLKILVEVQCETQCKYSLNLVYKEKITYQAEKGGKIDIIFKESEMREILLKIPRQKGNASNNMLIQAEFKNIYSFNYQVDFDVYGDKGPKTPETKQKAKYSSIWINENILAIPLQKRDLCQDCTFSIVIKAPKKAIVQFSAVLYEDERELNLSQQTINGVVMQDLTQYYTIEFDDMLEYERSRVFEGEGKKQKFASSLLFNLIPYNGNPDLYIHYGENMPSSRDKFQWKSETSLRQDLILITSDELNQIGYTQKSKIFVAVYGKETSAYQMRIDIYTDGASQNIYLQHNQPLTGYVGKLKLQNYSLRVDGSVKRDIDIVLQSYSGNPDLFVKKWKYGDGGEQLITNEDIDTFFQNINNDQSNPDKKIPFIGWSTNKQGQDVVKIKYDPNDCMVPDIEKPQDDGNKKIGPIIDDRMMTNFCIYQIAIFGNDESNKYILGAYSTEPSSILPIRENQPEYVFLDQNDKKFFSYKPMSLDTEIKSIRFQIYYASGFAMIAADRQFKNFENKPEKDFMSSKSNHYVEYKESDLEKGNLSDYTYFIQIKATERTNAQVVIEIIRKNQKKIHYNELLSGVSSKLIINPKGSKHFKFSYQYGKEQTVVARSDSSIRMYLGENKKLPPTQFANTYNADSNTQSTNNVKRINVKSSLTVEEGYLYGTVENITDEEIIVMVQCQSDTINLDLNVSVEDILIPDVQKIYFFNIYPDIAEEEIYLYVQPSGTVLDQKLTGFFKINQKLVDIFKDNEPVKMFKVEQDLLRKECLHLFEVGVWQDCQVMIEVYSSQEQRLIVSANAPKRPSYIQFYGSTISQLPLINQTRKFLYYVYGSKELILTVQSFSYQIQLMSKLLSQKQFREMDVSNGSNFPKFDDDSKQIQIYTKPNLVHQVRINPVTYKNESCHDGCFLLLSVVLPQNFEIENENKDKDKNENKNENENENENDKKKKEIEIENKNKKLIGNIIKLSITGDKIIELVEGESIQGTVEKEEMVYYRVYVPMEKNKEKLIINLTPLDNGDPDLYLNKDSSKLPTIKKNEHDLKSSEIAGDFLFVDKNTFKNSKDSDGIAGYYIVGVYGGSKSTYQISYQTGKHRIQKVDKDTIHQSTIKKGDTQYFVFHKKEKGFFTVVTNMSSGSAGDSYIFLKEFMSERGKVKDFMNNLADPNSADITTKHSNHKEILRYEKHDCVDCTYVIGVKADRKISFSLSVNIDGGVAQIQNNKNHLVYLKQGVISKLRFFSQDDFNLYVTAYSGHCIEVRINYGKSDQKKELKPKLCRDSKDTKPSGFDSFNLFIQHPDKEATKQGGLHYHSIFDIELISSLGDEKVIIQGVTGGEARLISAGIPLEQSMTSNQKQVQYTYYSSHEELQSVQVHISPEPGSEDALTFLDFDMFVQDKERKIFSNTIAHQKDLYAKSFITNMDQPYILNVTYKGPRSFKFSLLLKETNQSSIPILSGSVMDVLPLKETSNYVVYVKPKQQILIQNFNCISDQNIFVYTNSTDMLSQNLQNAERVTRKSTSNHEIQIMKISPNNQGAIYIQKKTNKQSKEKVSKSLILSETFQENENIIYNHIQIAESGMLHVHQEEKKVEVSFKDIECMESDCDTLRGLDITNIEYTLHISENTSDLQRMTNCLIRESTDLSVNDKIPPISLKSFSPQIQETRKFVIDKDLIPKEVNKIYVSVSASVKLSSTDQNSYRFIYGTFLVDDLHTGNIQIIEDKSDSNLGFIIAVCAVSIIILVIIVLQLYRRYKQVHQKLKYEMSDVRNVAHSDIENESVPDSRAYNSILPDKGQSEMIEMK